MSSWSETLAQDVRYGARVLVQNPGFACVAVLTLAIGIGANTAVFSLAYQLLFRQLPVTNPEQLVILRSPGVLHGSFHFDGDISGAFSYPMYRQLRANAPVFSGVLARFPATLSVGQRELAERRQGELVSGNYFEVLGVKPAMGRVFSPQDEGSPGANPVAVLAHGYWKERFGGDPNIVNTQIHVNGIPLTVIGVAAPDFRGVQNGLPSDIFIPLTMKRQMTPRWDGLEDHSEYWLALMARLRPGLSIPQAQSAEEPGYRWCLETELPTQKLSEAERAKFLARKLLFVSGRRGLLLVQDDARDPVLFLIAMVTLILVVTCTNLAALLIAKGEARRREFAIRLALGASRLRVFRQLFTESLILALAGGAAGVALALAMLYFFVTSIRQAAGVLDLKAQLDLPMLAFALVVSAITVLLFGLVPALKLVRIDPQLALGEQVNVRSGSTLKLRLRKTLLVSQVAVAVVLVAAAGLFTASLLNLQKVDLGFSPEYVFEFSLAPELNNYSVAQTVTLADRLRSDVGRVPGVLSVSAAEFELLSQARYMTRLNVSGYTPAPEEKLLVEVNWISPGYFSSLKIPLQTGRDFSEFDLANSPKVAVVNQAFVKRFFAHTNPVGSYIALGTQTSTPDTQIVGVVSDTKNDNPRERIGPYVYLPYPQNDSLGQLTFYVRTIQPPETVSPDIRRIVRELDAGLPIYNQKSLSQQLRESMLADRVLAFLSVGLGSLAGIIAAVGLYGVMAYIVVKRTHEIGVRIALGATPRRIAWLVLREVVLMASVGFIVGLGAILASSRLLGALLFGITGTSPLVFAMTAGCVVVLATIAGVLPAYKAAGLSPTVALRYE